MTGIPGNRFVVGMGVGLALAWLAGARPLAKGQRPATDPQTAAIKSEVRLVLVDVVVTESGRRPAGGLRKEDFQVAEDGHPQTISFFEEHKDVTPKPVSLPSMPADVFTNYPTTATTDSVNVLLLDSLNTQARDQTYIRPQMEKYLQAAIAAPTGARLAIFTLGSRLRMVRGFTADSSASLAALSDPKSGTEPKFEPQIASPHREVSEAAVCAGIRSPVGLEACLQFLAEERGARAGDRVGMTLQAFQALARYLAPIPGRKNVIWVAGSFPIRFFPDSGTRGKFTIPRPTGVQQQTADLLTADQVAVYPILASGLDTETVYDPNNAGKPIEAAAGDRGFSQIAMETLARDTGGKAFYNTNGLSEAISEAIANGSHYYTLAYTPTNENVDGKYRHIEVKVAGTYQASYRRGYVAENLASHSNDGGKNDALAPLMNFGMPDFSQILYKVRVTILKEVRPASTERAAVVRYGLDFAITPTDLHLETSADGVRRGKIEVMLVVYDQAGQALNSFRKRSEIVLDPTTYAEVARIGLQMHREIDIPHTGVLLRSGLYDLNSEKAGTMGIWLGGSGTQP
jgi:VWFA-related protein